MRRKIPVNQNLRSVALPAAHGANLIHRLYQEDYEAIGERAGRHPAYPHYRSATTSSRVIPRPYRPVPCSPVFYASNLVALGRSIAFVFRHVSVSTLVPSCDGILCGRSLIGGRNVAHSRSITEVGRGAHCNGIQPSGLCQVV